MTRGARLAIVAASVCLAGCSHLSCARTPSVSIRDGTIARPDGAALYYRTVGTGPQLVIVPLAYWNQARFEGIAGSRTIVFYDPRGRRRSSPVLDPSQFGIETDLADLAAVHDHFGGGPASLIGTSYFGALVARYAILHPDRVNALILVGSLYPRRQPHITYDPPEAARRRDPLAVRELENLRTTGVETADPERFCQAYWKVEGPMTVGDPASLAARRWPCDLPNEWPANLSAWGVGVFRSLGDWDWTREVRSLTVPTLVVHGDRDLMVPRSSSEEWAEALPRGTLHVLQGAGHVPWWEFADVMFPMVDRFLREAFPQASARGRRTSPTAELTPLAALAPDRAGPHELPARGTRA